MAQKRMFDISITKQDKFIDLPAEAKALYFLLGMEADDEGFVTPKIVMRIHLFSEDVLKILILKNFLIPFKSGVVVITDFKKNNWLNSKRIIPTIYSEELKTLAITDNRYMLSNGLTDVKHPLGESRIEQNRIEESNITKVIEIEISENKDLKEQKEVFGNKEINDLELALGRLLGKVPAVKSGTRRNRLRNIVQICTNNKTRTWLKPYWKDNFNDFWVHYQREELNKGLAPKYLDTIYASLQNWESEQKYKALKPMQDRVMSEEDNSKKLGVFNAYIDNLLIKNNT